MRILEQIQRNLAARTDSRKPTAIIMKSATYNRMLQEESFFRDVGEVKEVFGLRIIVDDEFPTISFVIIPCGWF